MNWRFWDRSGRDDCAAIEPLLSRYSDDMISQAEKRRVEAHLPACPDCRQALDWMLATRQVIALRPSLAPPEDLRARIARAIAVADATKAPPVKAPAVTAPVRPVRRPLQTRPALAYGLSLILAAGIVTDLAWHNAARPTHNSVAVRPSVTPPAPRVATNAPGPQTSVVINTVLGQFNQTLRSALVAPVPPSVRLSPVRPDAGYVARVPVEAQPSRVARSPHTPVVSHLPVLPQQVPPMRVAVKPPRPAVTTKPVAPVPHVDSQQVASANVPPRAETHIPPMTAPAPASVPTPVHDAVHVAVRPLTLHEVLSHAVASMPTAVLTSNAHVVNAANNAAHLAVAYGNSDRSGTAAFVSSSLH